MWRELPENSGSSSGKWEMDVDECRREEESSDGHDSANESGMRCHVCWLQAWARSTLMHIAFHNLQSTFAYIISFVFHQNCTMYVNGRGVTYLHMALKDWGPEKFSPCLNFTHYKRGRGLNRIFGHPAGHSFQRCSYPLSQGASLSPRFSEEALSSLARSLIRVPWK